MCGFDNKSQLEFHELDKLICNQLKCRHRYLNIDVKEMLFVHIIFLTWSSKIIMKYKNFNKYKISKYLPQTYCAHNNNN